MNWDLLQGYFLLFTFHNKLMTDLVIIDVGARGLERKIHAISDAGPYNSVCHSNQKEKVRTCRTIVWGVPMRMLSVARYEGCVMGRHHATRDPLVLLLYDQQ